jgi:hypothetical protein
MGSKPFVFRPSAQDSLEASRAPAVAKAWVSLMFNTPDQFDWSGPPKMWRLHQAIAVAAWRAA